MPVDMEKWSKLGSLKDLQKDFKDTPKGKRLRSLNIDEVVSVVQVRHTFTGLEELAASLKELGQQSPIVVRPKNEDGKYVILQGERRWRAAKLAGLSRIDAIVIESDVDTAERILSQLTENIQRDDMRPLEIAVGIKALLDAGMKGNEIAAKLGHKPSFVVLYKGLLDLPDFIRELADKDVVKDATTLEILKKIYLASPDSAEELIQSHVDEEAGISRSAARALLRSCQNKQNENSKSTDSHDAQTNISAHQAQNEVEQEPIDETVEEPADDYQKHEGRSAIRHKLADDDDHLSAEDFALEQREVELPAGTRRVQTKQANLRLSMIDESTDEVIFGVFVEDIVAEDPKMICVYCEGHYQLWPVSKVSIESVSEETDKNLSGW